MVLEAVRKGFSIATKSVALVGILFIFNLVGNLASMPFAVPAGTTPSPQLTAPAIIFSLVFILVSIFFQGASLGLVRDFIKEGKMKLGSLISYGSKYYLRLFGLGLLIILIIAVVALIAGLIVAITAPLNNTVITAIAVTIAAIIGIAAGLLYLIPLMLSPYVLICDETGIVESMKKSLKVAKNPFSRIFVLLLLFIVLILISLGIGLVVGFLIGLVSAMLPAAAGRMLMTVITSAINSYLGIVMMASFMIFYLGIAEKPKAEKVF